MKKIITVLLLACISYLFAESYEELFTKAQEYENNKQWVHALGTYYDAIELEKSEKAASAMNKFYELSEVIKSGKPGYGDFDEFDLYENWVLLLREYDSYIVENPPISIQIQEIKRVNVDLENKTADYEMKYSINRSNQKSRILKDAIYKGCPKNITAYKQEEVEKNGYKINNVPLVEIDDYDPIEYKNAITNEHFSVYCNYRIYWKGIVSTADDLFTYDFDNFSIKNIKKEHMKFFEGDGIKSLTFTITDLQLEYGPSYRKRKSGEIRPKYTLLNPKAVSIDGKWNIHQEESPVKLIYFLQEMNEKIAELNKLKLKLDQYEVETTTYIPFVDKYVTSSHKGIDNYEGQNYFYNSQVKTECYSLVEYFINTIVEEYVGWTVFSDRMHKDGMDYFFDNFEKINLYFPENAIVKEYNVFFNYLPYNWEKMNSDSEYLINKKPAKKNKKNNK